MPDDPRSPRIARLAADLKAGRADAVDTFWHEVAGAGAPLVETGARDSSGDRRLVTLVWRDATSQAVLVGGGLSADPPGLALERLAGSDVWYRTVELPSDTRTMYWFVPGGDIEAWRTWSADPLNPRRHVYFEADEEAGDPAVEASILELPDAPADVWSQLRANNEKGRLETHAVRSGVLGNERDVAVYVPAAELEPDAGFGLLVLLDGQDYVRDMGVAAILDNLIAEGRIPPVLGVFPNSLGQEVRSKEMACDPQFNAFLQEELLPWVETLAPIGTSSAQRVIGGSSFGGLAAAYAGLAMPDAFGGVVSQSGAFQWRRDDEEEPAWLPRNLPVVAPAAAIGTRFSMRVGILETFDVRIINESVSLLDGNRMMRDALRGRAADVTYAEYSGGHDHVCWRQALPEQLIELFGPGRAGSA